MALLDGSHLVLDRWPATPIQWSALIESTNIPPSIIRRGIAFDPAEPILSTLTLPPDSDESVVRVMRDVTCPECDRPVVVVVKPWAREPRKTVLQMIAGGLEALDWHSRHPRG